MVTWSEFMSVQPELAALGEERFDRTGLALVGTLRKDGWPRISPVEPILTTELYLGMMWQSTKALDLLRDDRCLVHSTVADKSGTEGEFKVYGRARSVDDPDERERYGQALEAKIDWRPEGDFHLFAVGIEQIGVVTPGDDMLVARSWRPGGEVMRRELRP